MHGATTATATAFLLAVEFGHDRFGRNPPCQGLSMLAIGGNEVVIRRQRLQHADPDCLFTIIEMQESADFHGAVELGRFFLKPADSDHLFQQIEAAFTIYRHATL
jgi:hypothetical protein